MYHCTRLIHGTVAASLACAAFSIGTATRVSAEESEADALAQLIAEATVVAGDSTLASPPLLVADDVATIELHHGTVAMALGLNDGVTVSSTDGPDLAISLPSVGHADGRIADDCTVVYRDAVAGAAGTARADDSVVQPSMVIDSQDASTADGYCR